MNFSGKITQLFIGISLSLISGALIVRAEPKTAQASPIKVAQALTPEEINLRVKQTIVRIDGANIGSGAVIDYADGVYTVLTNWHVVKSQGEYIVQTIDGRKHEVDSQSIKQLPELDLAILKFDSKQNYQVAETGDSGNLNEGQSIYFAGYPGELRQEDNRYYRFFTVSLVGILPKSTKNGYALVYSGEAFPGMSGGPVLNQQGLVIGIHGEANVHAVSGATSNYGIPINTYKNAIALLDQKTDTSAAAAPTNNLPAATAEPEPEPESEPEPEPESSNTAGEEVEEVNSVPTFTEESNVDTAVDTAVEKPVKLAEEPTEKPAEVAVSKPEPTNEDIPKQPSSQAEKPQKYSLVSDKTGIDYRQLRDLLKAKKWSEADIHTYKLVEQIVKTAKGQNKNIFIELKTIANFSCPDIRTIDSLWQEHSGNKFGFSSQQEIWQSVNQKGDFSTQTWRQFATEVGWKKGEVSNGSGYLLYEQLNFDPNNAPTGHLPWWFALPQEEQNVIKQLFARCNFNPDSAELAQEEKQPKLKKPPKS